jgi:predicted permease
VLDDALAMLGSAVVPTCLVLIGFSLAQYGLKGRLRGALTLVMLKLALLPAVVLAVAHLGFGLSGVPLGVVVMLAALPVGSNALIFAQRYGVHEAEATAGIVVTTALFVVTASGWLTVLAWVG